MSRAGSGFRCFPGHCEASGDLSAIAAWPLPWGVTEAGRGGFATAREWSGVDVRIPAPWHPVEEQPVRTENEGRTRRWLRRLVVPAGLAFWAALALTRPPS